MGFSFIMMIIITAFDIVRLGGLTFLFGLWLAIRMTVAVTVRMMVTIAYTGLVSITRSCVVRYFASSIRVIKVDSARSLGFFGSLIDAIGSVRLEFLAEFRRGITIDS